MTRFHDFDADRNTEPITFRFGGRDFTAKATCPSDVMLRFIADGAADSQSAQVDAVDAFMRQVLDAGDVEKWEAAKTDPVAPVSIKDCSDLINWLVEEYSGRPTSEPSPSADGSSTDGESSTDGAPPVALSLAPSPATGS